MCVFEIDMVVCVYSLSHSAIIGKRMLTQKEINNVGSNELKHVTRTRGQRVRSQRQLLPHRPPPQLPDLALRAGRRPAPSPPARASAAGSSTRPSSYSAARCARRPLSALPFSRRGPQTPAGQGKKRHLKFSNMIIEVFDHIF